MGKEVKLEDEVDDHVATCLYHGRSRGEEVLLSSGLYAC